MSAGDNWSGKEAERWMAKANLQKPRKGKRLIFRASITLPGGTKLYTKDYGLKGFPIWV